MILEKKVVWKFRKLQNFSCSAYPQKHNLGKLLNEYTGLLMHRYRNTKTWHKAGLYLRVSIHILYVCIYINMYVCINVDIYDVILIFFNRQA